MYSIEVTLLNNNNVIDTNIQPSTKQQQQNEEEKRIHFIFIRFFIRLLTLEMSPVVIEQARSSARVCVHF